MSDPTAPPAPPDPPSNTTPPSADPAASPQSAAAPKTTGFRVLDSLAAGYDPDEVTSYLAENPKSAPHFDVKGALAAGYSSREILAHMVGPAPLANLPEDQQQDLASKVQASVGAGYTPQQITSYVAGSQSPLAGHIKAALTLGYDPAAIVDQANGTGGGVLQGAPIVAPVMRGVAHAMSGVADLATDAGLPGVGSAIRSRIDQEDLQAPQSGASLVSDIKGGRLGSAIEDLPSAVLEQAPTVIPALAAGALTGGAADAPLLAATLRAGAAGVLSGATQGDAAARQRAANNGRSTPSTGDLVAGILGSGAAGAVGSIGLGGTSAGLTGALQGVAKHAVADAAQPELQSLAGSAGTAKGAQNTDPATAAASALTGAATRGVMEAPSAASAAYTAISPAARAANLRAQYAALSPDQQQAVQTTASAGGALKDAQQPGANGTVLSAPDAARVAIARLAGGINSTADTLQDQGVIGDDDKAVIGTAVKAAASPSDTLTPDHLAAIDALQLDPSVQGTITGNLRTIDRLSQATKPQPAGPLQNALSEAATPLGGAIVGSVIGGGAPGAVAGAVAGHDLRTALRPALSGLGAKLDGMLGLAKPSLTLQAQKAATMLAAAGQPVPDTRTDLMNAVAGTQDAMSTQRRILGLPPSPVATPSNDNPAAGSATSETGFGPPFDEMARQQAADESMVNSWPRVAPVQGQAGGVGAAQASTPSSGFPGRPADFDPTAGKGGLNAAAALQARRLPAWQFGLGTALENALHISGQARAVNPAAEVGQALDELQGEGLLDPDVVEALRGHQGRVVPAVYNLLRNAMLVRNGVDRRVMAAQQAGQQPAEVMPMAAE